MRRTYARPSGGEPGHNAVGKGDRAAGAEPGGCAPGRAEDLRLTGAPIRGASGSIWFGDRPRDGNADSRSFPTPSRLIAPRHRHLRPRPVELRIRGEVTGDVSRKCTSGLPRLAWSGIAGVTAPQAPPRTGRVEAPPKGQRRERTRPAGQCPLPIRCGIYPIWFVLSSLFADWAYSTLLGPNDLRSPIRLTSYHPAFVVPAQAGTHLGRSIQGRRRNDAPGWSLSPRCLAYCDTCTRRTGTGMLQMSAPPAGRTKNASRRLARASA